MAQLTYDKAPAVAQAGMLAEQFSLRQVDSFLAEGDILFGQPVVYGTSEEQCKPAALVTDKFLGLALLEKNVEQDAAGVAKYADEDMASVMRYGRVWAIAGEAVAAGEPVFAGLGGDLGKFYNDSATNTRLECKGKFVTSAAADGDLVLIELVWA